MERIETLRTAERTALLDRLRAVLQADSRVVAAWLYGSLGRGDEDAWSDLDVWVVVADDLYDPAMRHDFPPRLRDVLFTEEAPQNGPPGGMYLMSAHDAPTGPHLVDWYLQPLRFAKAPERRAVLVERAAFPAEPEAREPAPEFAGTPEEDASNKASLFWAMLLVQAKYVARKPVEEGMGFEEFLLLLLRDVARHRGREIDEMGTPGLRLASEKLDRLERLSGRMAEIVPEQSHLNEAVGRLFATVRRAVAV